MRDYDPKYENDYIDTYTDKIDYLLKQCEELKILDVVLDNLGLCKKVESKNTEDDIEYRKYIRSYNNSL